MGAHPRRPCGRLPAVPIVLQEAQDRGGRLSLPQFALADLTRRRQLSDPPERLEEAADVYEVMLAVAALLGVTLADVATKAATKRAERGAFTE
jgi:hypothetical protein